MDPFSLGLGAPVYGSMDKTEQLHPKLQSKPESVARGSIQDPVTSFSNQHSPFVAGSYDRVDERDLVSSSLSSQAAEIQSLREARLDLLRTHEEILALEREIRLARHGK